MQTSYLFGKQIKEICDKLYISTSEGHNLDIGEYKDILHYIDSIYVKSDILKDIQKVATSIIYETSNNKDNAKTFALVCYIYHMQQHRLGIDYDRDNSLLRKIFGY